MMAFKANDPEFETMGEARMLPYLIQWLRTRRWVRSDTIVVREFPVHGRRVDLVTMTRSGVMSAYELKLGSFGRVLEQAAYNLQSFDKSWIVVANKPREGNLAEAKKYGIGVIVIFDKDPIAMLYPGAPVCHTASRERHKKKLMEAGEMYV